MNKTAKGSAAIFLALAALQPAFAADSKTVPSAAAAAESGSAKAGAKAQSAEKYCFFLEPETGSRIPVHSCRTQSEWLAAGFDIKAKK